MTKRYYVNSMEIDGVKPGNKWIITGQDCYLYQMQMVPDKNFKPVNFHVPPIDMYKFFSYGILLNVL